MMKPGPLAKPKVSMISWRTSPRGPAARRLGHANASVTTRHYARPIDGRDAQVAKQLDKLGHRTSIGHAAGTEAPKAGS